MPAIITDRLKKEILLKIQEDIDSDANNYYIAIGKSVDWNSTDAAPTPLNNLREIRKAQYAQQSVKNIEANSFVIPRYTWSLGATYQAWSDRTVGHPTNSFYVITDENQVYVCLEQGKNTAGQSVTSTIKPTGTATTPFETADGYVWKFLYSIGALRSSRFLSANFMPVTKFGAFDSDDPADHVEQVGIQNAAVKGQIIGYEVLGGGSGYTSAPTATIVGDGVGAGATVTVSGGAVTKVELKDSDGNKATGRNYTRANVTLSGGAGTGANIRPVLGPYNGLGADPRDDLKATAIMFTAKPDGDEGSNWVTGNDFRQVALIKNPYYSDSDGKFTGVTGNSLRRLEFASITSNFTVDKKLLGATSQAQAFVVRTDSDTVWYYQDSDTGFTDFVEAETISEIGGGGAGTLEAASADVGDSAYVSGDVDMTSGEVLYIDNRAAINRSKDQTEDIKIVIQL